MPKEPASMASWTRACISRSSSGVGARSSKPITAIRTVPLADQGRLVGGGARLFHRVEVFAEGSPVPRHALGRRDEGGITLEGVGGGVAERRGGEPAVAAHLRGDPLPQLVVLHVLVEEREVRVGVHVNKTWADAETLSVDDRRRGLPYFPNGRYYPARDCHVAVIPGVARPVNNPTVANNNVCHRRISLRWL